MLGKKRKSRDSNHARDRAEPRKPKVEGNPTLRRVVTYQISDTEDGKPLKWTLYGEHIVTLKDSVLGGEVKLTYRILPKLVEALEDLLTNEEVRREIADERDSPRS